MEEFEAMGAMGSSAVVAANARGNAVEGRFYGPNSANCTMSNITGCIFMPASGKRDPLSGSLSEQGSTGYFWVGNSEVSLNYDYWYFGGATRGNNQKLYGHSIRCVQ